MATIANLLIRIAADNSQLRSTLARSASDLNRFARSIGTTNRSFGNFGAVIPNRVRLLTRRVRDMERIFGQASTQARIAFERGLPRSAFERRGREIGRALRTGLMREVERIEADIQARRITEGVGRRLQAGLLARIPRGINEDPQHFNNQLLAVSDIATSAGRTLTRGLTVPIVGFGIAAAKSAGEFEKNFNRVRAVTEGTEADFEALRNRAIELGQITPFNPAEIATGLAILGQAGLKASASLGAIQSVANLAAIEQVNLDDATKILIHTMAQFGISADQMGNKAEEFADKMTVASLSGTVNITELGTALNYAGAIAHQTGQDFDLVLALLTKMAQQGLVASVGGTALRNIIARLANPTRDAQKALNDLAKANGGAAISFRNSEGQFRSVLEILEQLSKAKINVADIFRVFNLRAGPGFAALKQVGVKEIIELTAKIKNAQGEAQRVADIQFSGLLAEIRKLLGAFQALAIAIGDSGLLGALTNLVTRLANFVRSLKDIDAQNIRTIAGFLAFAAALGPILTMVGAVIRGIVQLRVASALLAGAGGLGGLGALLTGGGAIVVGLGVVAYLLGRAANRAINLQQAIGALDSKLAQMSTQNLERFARDTQLLLDLTNAKIEELNAKPFRTQRDGNLDRETVKRLDEIEKLKDRAKELQDQLNRINAARGEASQRAAQEAKAQADAAKFAEDLKNAMANMPGLDESLTSPAAIKALVKETAAITANLRLAVEASKGLEDREERLIEPLTRARDQLAKVKQVIESVDPTQLPAGLANAATELERLIKVGEAPDPLAFGELVREADFLLARMEEVRDSTQDLNERQRLMAPLIAQAARLEADLAAAIDAQGGIYEANNKLLQTRNRLLRQLPPPDPIEQAGLQNFGGDAARRIAQQMQIARAEMEQAPNLQAWDAARKKLQQLGVEALKVRDRFVFALQASGLSPNEALRVWNAFVAILKEAGFEFDQLHEEMTKLDRLQVFDRMVGEVANLIDAVELLSDGLDLMLRGISEVIRGFEEIEAARNEETGKLNFLKALPGMIGAAAGIIDLVSGIGDLFGGGDEELKQLQASNTAALRELKNQLEQTNFGLAGNIDVQNALGQLDLGRAFAAGLAKEGGGLQLNATDRQEQITDELDRQLKELGLSFADLARLMEETGISIFDEKGKLRPEGVEDLEEAARLAAERLRHFSDTIDNQLKILDLKTKLQGPEALDTATQVANQTQVLTENLGARLNGILGNIDTTTAEGRERLRQALLDMVLQIEKGAIAAEDFGKFGSADELLEFLDRYVDTLNELDKKTEEAAKTMANVPDGWRIALRRFESQDIELPGQLDLGNDVISGPFGELPASIEASTAPVVDSLSVLTAATQSGSGEIVIALQELQAALTGVQPSQDGSDTAPGSESAAGSLLDLLRGLSGGSGAQEFLNALRGASAQVGPEVQRMIQVIMEIIATEAAASMRGFQETIIRRAGTLDPDFGVSTNRSPTSGTGTVEFNISQINIQGADKTAREQWRDIKRVARDEAKAKFGDTRRWGEVP